MVTPVLFGVGAALGWGLHDYFAKVLLRKLEPFQTIFSIKLVELALLAVLLLFLPANPSFFSSSFVLVALAAGALNAAAWLFFIQALKAEKLSLVTPIAASFGAFSVIISVLFFGEFLALSQLLLVVLVIAGVVLAAYKPIEGEPFSLRLTASGKKALAAAVLWGGSYPLIGYLANNLGWFTSLLASQFFIVVSLLAVGLVQKKPLLPPAVAPFLILAVLDGLGNIFYNLGDEAGLTSIVIPIGSAFTVVAVLAGYFFLHERLTRLQKLGIAAVILGVIALSIF